MSTRTRNAVLGGALALSLVGGGGAYALLHKTAGPRDDGTAVNSIGQWITPAGRSTTLGNLPLNAALHPDGKHLLVTNNGQGVQSLQLVDADTGAVTQTLSYPTPESLYVGLAWSADGKTAYASAAANSKIRVLTFADGRLTEGAPITLPTKSPEGKAVTLFPAGLALTPDGKRLVVADQLGDAVTVVDLATRTQQTVAAGHRPFYVTVAKDGTKAYVTNQGGNTVDVVDLTGATPALLRPVRVGLHPNKSVLSADGQTLYVANGDDDTVSVVRTATDAPVTTIKVSRNALVGSNPTGLGLGKDGSLYATLSGNNDVAVIDPVKGRVKGLIPTGWYPSQVVVRGDQLLVTSAKGLGAGPNTGPGRPDPESSGKTDPQKYTGSMMEGTLTALPVPDDRTLGQMTQDVERNNAAVAAKGAVIPVRPGQPSPIRHVIYVVKENRTYDQVLGSLGKGNGDPSINLFGDESAPNTRELARRFTTIDNFYADAEVSANGWNWVAQANSNPFAEQMWPANYSGRKAPYPSENGSPEIAAQDPGNSFLWQRLAKARVSFKNFGFYVGQVNGQFHAEDPVLDARTDHLYQGYDLACPDSSGTFKATKATCLEPRIDHWLTSFRGWQAKGDMPTVQFVRLPNDHTSGTKAGQPTPKAMVADNDYALGRLVDAVSHSRYWMNTVILVTEDDAQNGPDHVDAHRTLALAISPFSQTGTVDSTFYSTASMVRTIGLLAGIKPLTQFDDYSTPMSASFTATPNPRAYQAIRPTYPMTTVNAATAPLAGVSARQDLTKEDQIDEQTFNQAIWQSVRGTRTPMPTPRHDLLGDTAKAEQAAERAAEADAAAKAKAAGAPAPSEQDDD